MLLQLADCYSLILLLPFPGASGRLAAMLGFRDVSRL